MRSIAEGGPLVLESPSPSPPAGDGRIAGTVVVELDDVTRSYDLGGETTVTALDHASMTVRAGELVVVLGPSGSGKSTLLNLIGALDTPTSGRIAVAGQDITRMSRRELFAFRRHAVAFIFQSFNLFPQLTARENVQFGIDVSRRDGPENDAVDVLASVGLAERMDHLPHELSGGEQQRVAIARALATGNPVLLADEPTGELDFRTGLRILELLAGQARGRGTAVIVVTHNREIARMADRIIELSSGRIVSDGPQEGGPAPIADLHW
jgi:putative ABC transport system ATP-binding protein